MITFCFVITDKNLGPKFEIFYDPTNSNATGVKVQCISAAVIIICVPKKYDIMWGKKTVDAAHTIHVIRLEWGI